MLSRKPKAGVSLAELMVAMAVILIGMSGVAASLYFGFTKKDHGEKVAAATQYSRILIQLAMGRNYNDGGVPLDAANLPTNASGMNDLPGDPPRPIADPPFTENDFLPVGEDDINPRAYLEDFRRKITISRRGAKGTPEEFLELMTVTIFWNDKGVERSVTTAAVLPTAIGAP